MLPFMAALSRIGTAWPVGPSRPRLADGAVHVWLADLDIVAVQPAEHLSEAESARAARLLSERDRLLWTRARGLLRVLLGRYLDVEPRALSFAAGAHGKPTVRGPREPLAGEPLEFNLSHSRSLALYAFSRAGAVGVDVEAGARRTGDELDIARRLLGEQVTARLRTLADAHARRAEFLRAWTRHEARAKCLGTGIGAGSRDARERTLWDAELALAEDGDARAFAAVACAREPRELLRFRWSGAS
jgi:4'-phosphopantetheinyl transferase